jgi:hypothetical protein
VTTIEVYGANLQPMHSYWLGMTPLPAIFLDPGHASVKAPSGLPAGVYDLSVRVGNQVLATLPGAFTVLERQSTDDLVSDPAFLWTDPVAPRQAEPAQLGLTVQRLGGSSGVNLVQVRFLVQQGNQAPVEIGSGIAPALGVDDSASTSGVPWTPGASGVYTLTALIDPANQIAETDEGNNQVSRTITVLPPAQDAQPPVIDSFAVNQGSLTTDSQHVTLNTVAHDQPNGAGLGYVMYVEMHWSSGAQTWVPIQFTEWLPYGGAHTWQMHPAPGMRYLQAWVRDLAGNIAAVAAKALINYAPATDTLLTGETRIFRLYVEAGQCLRVYLTPATGDPDLYVWPPGYQPGQTYWYSIAGPGQPDQVEIAVPVTGQYQVEVEGVETTTFGVGVTITAGCTRAASAPAAAPAKTPRSSPRVSTTSEPAGALALPEQTIAVLRAYLPSVTR